jgi:hypothetical protein
MFLNGEFYEGSQMYLKGNMSIDVGVIAQRCNPMDS